MPVLLSMPCKESARRSLMEPSDVGSTVVMIVAGEASGDLHGAMLVREMRQINPAVDFHGVGGAKMKEAGVRLLADAADIGVVGVTEVFSKIGTFIKIISGIKKSMDRLKPALVILIDFPDFNLNIVAKAAKKRGIRVFYYISPQVWAWREGRVKQIKKLVDKMAVILPFEVDFYASHGYTVQYVGHPLVDKVKTSFTTAAARLEFGLSATRTTIGLLPGSRTAEVSRLLPEMMKAAQKISAQIPQVQYILPLADTLNKDRVAGIINPSGMDVKIVSGRTYDVLAACDLAIVTSGTATLEAGLLGVPMVIIYKMSVLSALIGKLIINPKYIGLVNIIAGGPVAPELIQLKATGERIAAEALSILSNPDRRLEMISKLKNIRQKLGDPGAARKAAQIACDMI